MFQNSVVTEALTHGYLMDAILAFTAVHIASEMDDPVAMSPYIQRALQYQNHVLPALQSVLYNLHPSECGAIFTCSMITMACAIVLPLLPHRNHAQMASSTESLLNMYKFLKGIASVVSIGRQWLEHGPFKTVFGAEFDSSPFVKEETDTVIQRLKHLNDISHGGAGSFQHRIYDQAIDSFETVFETHKFGAIRWLVDVEDSVVDGLRKKDPVALMIFNKWGTILAQLDELWWARYLGQRLVEELSGDLAQQGIAWSEASELTRHEVSLETVVDTKHS